MIEAAGCCCGRLRSAAVGACWLLLASGRTVSLGGCTAVLAWLPSRVCDEARLLLHRHGGNCSPKWSAQYNAKSVSSGEQSIKNASL
jgi:hypothetical protein